MQALGMQASTVGEGVPCDLSALLESLRVLIQERSVTIAPAGAPDFKLASGRFSRYYCDVKKVTLSPEGSKLTGEVLFHLLDAESVEAVGGLQLGSAFIATAVALVSHQHGRPIYGFTVRERQKEHGTLEKIADSFHPDNRELLCAGRCVAVVDDVVTGGESILKAVRAVQDRGCKIVAVVTLVDRNEGGGERLRDERLPYYPLFNAAETGVLTVNADLVGRSPIPQRHTV